jgi:hypothetical protein
MAAAAGAGARNNSTVFDSIPLYTVTPGYGRITSATPFRQDYKSLSFRQGKHSYIIKSPIGRETELIFVNSKDVPESLIVAHNNYSNSGKAKQVRRGKNGLLRSNPPQYISSSGFLQVPQISQMYYNPSKPIGEQHIEFYKYSQSPDISPRYLVAVYLNHQSSGDHSYWNRSGNFIFIDNHGQEYSLPYQSSGSSSGGGGLEQPKFIYLFYNDDLYPSQLPDVQIDFIKSIYNNSQLILGTSFEPIRIMSFLKMVNALPSLCSVKLSKSNNNRNTEPSKIINIEPSKTVVSLEETEPSRYIPTRKNNRHSLPNTANTAKTVKNMYRKLQERLGRK